MVISTSNNGAATIARAESQKTYKKLKKKRRLIKKAEKKKQREIDEAKGLAGDDDTSASSKTRLAEENKGKQLPTKWCRVGKDDGCKKAIDRPIDANLVNKLLEERSNFKTEKNYIESDKTTRRLVDMEIVYDDAKKEWHTRLLSTVGKKAKEMMK